MPCSASPMRPPPRQIYSTLDTLSHAAAALGQAMHQLAAFHNGPSRKTGWAPPDSAGARALSYQVSWEMHRAGEILRQVAGSIDRAHEVEGAITYVYSDFPQLVEATSTSPDRRLGL